MDMPYLRAGLVALGSFASLAGARAEPPSETMPAAAAIVLPALPEPPGLIVLIPVPATLPRPPLAAPQTAGSPATVADGLSQTLKTALETRYASAPDHAKTAALANAPHKQREAIMAFYAGRQFAPAWIEAGTFSAAARAVRVRLQHAGDDALDLRDTPLPGPSATPDLGQSGWGAMIAAEIALSEAVAAYAQQASGGRIDPQRISLLIDVKPEFANAVHVLAQASVAGEGAGDILLALNPPHSGYGALRAKLGELRRERGPVAQGKIPAGPILRVGMRDPRVPLIRARFGLDAAPAVDPADVTYDVRIANAIADFQRANGLPASGILTARTIAALSGGEPSRLENEIIANMERWRWLPRDMGQKRIEVNIPDFSVRVLDGEAVIHQARVVVGKPDTPTPVFSNAMQFLIVNPYWNVPPSIIKNEMLPRLAQDPDYLHRLGYEVIQHGHNLVVRQPPGERNALGRIKFMFPNDHAVYLHDTPSRALFANEKRAYSHGCVRVDQPFALAATVLGSAWNESKIKSLIGGAQRTVYLPKPLPIHIEYFTAFVDGNGRLQLRDDVYGYSRRLKIALGLEL